MKQFPTPSSLQHHLDQLLARQSLAEPVSEFVLALSGGLDSMVLLDLLSKVELSAPLKAVYIDHGLHAASKSWGEFCTAQCRQRKVPLQMIEVDARPENGQGPEDAARRARYAALAMQLKPNGVLFTAQHQDDQAETLLLQLLRGAGPKGLSAMPEINVFEPGYQARPLLNFSRQQLQEYAEQHELEWVEDPSNKDTNFDRNFLRQQVIPLLKQRWPAMASTLSRSARLCGEVVELVEQQAEQDLMAAQRGKQLDAPTLLALNEARQKQVLLAWLRELHAPMPSEKQLAHMLDDLLYAAEDAEPCVQWGGVQLRRYRQRLYLLSAESVEPPVQRWDLRSELQWGSQRFVVRESVGQGLSLAKLRAGNVSVRPRSGGEQLLLPGREHRHSLKKLLQEAGVPPWQREQLALLYVDEQLVAVLGHWLSADFIATEQESGLVIEPI